MDEAVRRPRPSRSQPAAVVVGLDCITGLQTARILRGRGIPVVGVADDPRHFACRTRACERIVYTETAGDALIESLRTLRESFDERAVLFPCTDQAVLAISRGRAELAAAYHVLLPPGDVVDLLLDKTRFLRHAQEQGLPVPQAFFLTERAEAEDAADALRFPAVLKPPVKTPQWLANVHAKAVFAEDGPSFLRLYDRLRPHTDVLVAQEWVEGGEANLYSVNAYFDSASEPLATFVARKLRQWPPATGTSCLGEECRNDAVLEEAVRLFRSVGFHGLAYLEMKKDDRTGRHLIIEPNVGRPTGRSAIAEAGGVELLLTAYRDAIGAPLPTERRQQYLGAKWIYFRNDVRSALYYWRRGELTLAGWWKSIRGRKVDAVFSWRDPKPFAHDIAQSAAALGRRPWR